MFIEKIGSLMILHVDNIFTWMFHVHSLFSAFLCSLSLSLSSKIKVWDLQAALDPRAPASTLCLRTLVVSVQVVNKLNIYSIPFLRLH